LLVKAKNSFSIGLVFWNEKPDQTLTNEGRLAKDLLGFDDGTSVFGQRS